MDAKVRIKMGTLEIDYEGSEAFLKEELPNVVKAFLELRTVAKEAFNTAENLDFSSGDKERSYPAKISTSTAAAKLQAKSGSDLALAAAAALVIGERKDSFSRAELLKAMQSAKAYYKASFGSNLSNYIMTLIKSQDLLDQGSERYGLQDKKRQELEKSLQNDSAKAT